MMYETLFSDHELLQMTNTKINNTYAEIKEVQKKQNILGAVLAGATVVYGIWTVAIVKQVLGN